MRSRVLRGGGWNNAGENARSLMSRNARAYYGVRLTNAASLRSAATKRRLDTVTIFAPPTLCRWTSDWMATHSMRLFPASTDPVSVEFTTERYSSIGEPVDETTFPRF